MLRNRWMLAAAVAAALCAPAWAAAPSQPQLGLDLAGIDHAVRPGDNFYDYANGDWMKTATIPADRSSTGTFLKVYQQAEKDTAALIRHAGASHPAPGSNAGKIAAY